MKRMLCFASRNLKELVRDPLNIAFGLGFPVVLLLLLSAIQANVPVALFAIDHLAPGIAVFGLSFIALFAATLISKDRSSSLMLRLFTSPLKAADFILGYTLPLVPIAVLQNIICLLVAALLGLKITVDWLVCIAVLIPVGVLFIGIGLLCGSLLNDKQVGGICGALLTNLCAWLSGTWFDLNLVGGAFAAVANCLPFVHAVNAAEAALAGNMAAIFPDLWWVIGYAIAILIVAVWCFSHKMSSDKA